MVPWLGSPSVGRAFLSHALCLPPPELEYLEKLQRFLVRKAREDGSFGEFEIQPPCAARELLPRPMSNPFLALLGRLHPSGLPGWRSRADREQHQEVTGFSGHVARNRSPLCQLQLLVGKHRAGL